MKRIVIQADEDLLHRARTRAAQRGVSIAQVVRDALERDLAVGAPPALRSIGVGASRKGDLSRRASDGDFEPRPSRS